MIATRVDKETYSIHRGDFSFESIKGFLTGLMTGKQTLSPLPKNLPEFLTVKEWDGKDLPPEEPASEEL